MHLEPSGLEDLEKLLCDQGRSLSEFKLSESSVIDSPSELAPLLGILVGHTGSIVSSITAKCLKTGILRTYRVENSASYGPLGEPVQWVKDFLRDIKAGEF